MMLSMLTAVVLLADAQESAGPRDATCFQIFAPYAPEVDIGADVAIVYGVDATFTERAAEWRRHGYTVSMMTGIAWGDYASYYGTGDAFKRDEVQTRKDGELRMHHPGVGYNVPSPEYVEYIKRYIDPAIEIKPQCIFLEEPEYWANTGWSEAFKAEWQRHYDEPWQAPDASPDAQYRASKLKYELYFDALAEVMAYIDQRAASLGTSIECAVPTHSLINYAHWRIVSPESHLMDIPQLDGYVAQVWTGTARTPNQYQGVRKERTFETAFLEFGQMWSMVQPTGKKVWFLHDPVEDNPNRSWNDYKFNYECTVVASLLWPQVHRFEVMPWPDRIFRGQYRPTDMDSAAESRAGIPAGYATEILTIMNALNDMAQTRIEYDTGSQGIGVIVSDSLMFQRAEPQPSDGDLGGFYGLALPLLKVGVPVAPVQLENAPYADTFAPFDVLFLTYEGQKPLKPDYHDAIAAWVRGGGRLVIVGDGSDPYHHVREWWNDLGAQDRLPYADLFERLGLDPTLTGRTGNVGEGTVMVLPQSPAELQRSAEGADAVRAAAAAMLAAAGRTLETQNYLRIQRGPYVIASVLDESVSSEALRLSGPYIDLFDPDLPVVREIALKPGERCLLYDVAHGLESGATVLAAAGRVRHVAARESELAFTVRGPAATQGVARVRLPRPPKAARADGAPIDVEWDEATRTARIRFANEARDVPVLVEF